MSGRPPMWRPRDRRARLAEIDRLSESPGMLRLLRSHPAPLPLAAALALAACASPAPAPAPAPTPRLPPGYTEQIAHGERVPLPLAEMFVPEGFAVPGNGEVPLCVHFQGGVPAAVENFARMQRPGVLIASTLAGRSGAFAAPYRDPAAFTALLAAGEAELARRCGRDVHFGPLL